MSIMVKGMNLPKNCHDCELCALINFDDDVFEYGCRVLKRMIYDDSRRLEGCPLIDIPPHGDLIDRDALPTNRVEWEDIANAPTIIPEEEGET